MGNPADRFPFIEFTPPKKDIVNRIDWQGAAKVFGKSVILTETQIEELKEIWYRYILRIVQYEKELFAKDFQDKLKYIQEHMSHMQEIFGNPSNAIEADIASAISTEFKLVGMDTPITYTFTVALSAIEKRLNEHSGKAVVYGYAYNELIEDMRVWAKKHNFVYGPFVDGENPSKFSSFLYILDKQLPKKFRKKSPSSEYAVAKRIKNLLSKKKKQD